MNPVLSRVLPLQQAAQCVALHVPTSQRVPLGRQGETQPPPAQQRPAPPAQTRPFDVPSGKQTPDAVHRSHGLQEPQVPPHPSLPHMRPLQLGQQVRQTPPQFS